jgi:hypothetical protein
MLFVNPCKSNYPVRYSTAVGSSVQVTDAGGALQVIKDKHWRDVGDVFHLPKTITSLSFVLKRGYMQYLWDYEQVYFHRKSGHPRVVAPASKYSKDHPHHDMHHGRGYHGVHRALYTHGGHHGIHPAHAVDAAAVMAVAALRGSCAALLFAMY